MTDCSAIKAELDAARAVLDRMSQPGVRAVQDSDGTRIEYTIGNLNAQRQKVAVLQARYDRCVNCRNFGPIGAIF